MLTSVSEITYPTTNSSNTSTYSVMGGVLNAPSTDTTASDNLAKSLLGNNCKKVDITANGVLNDLATPNMNTYSMNSTTNSSTLFSMEVDEIGNMTKFNGYDFNWNGRRLESISQDGVELISYKYNIDGQRVSKTIGGTTTEYFYNGDILAGQKTGNDVLVFMYDNNGDVFGFTYNGTPYYYIKNAQNDVYMIVDETGVAYVLYMYDAWGRVACYDGTDFGLATINPLMYRSYYIDVETGYFFYYLNSRYYLADLGRFVSADTTDILSVQSDLYDKNLFAYCDNNPVHRVDTTGFVWEALCIGFVAGIVGQYVNDVITNFSEGKTGFDVFAAKSSFSDYLSSGIGGAIAAIPGLNLIGTMAVGAIGSVVSDGLKGNINSVEDLGKSAFRGSIANGIGYGVSKGLAALKVKQIDSMPRSSKKIYLRDKLYCNSQKNVNINLKVFSNSSISSNIKNIEKQLIAFRAGVYSTITSTLFTMH